MRNKIIVSVLTIVILFLIYQDHQISNEMSSILHKVTDTIKNGTGEDTRQILSDELMSNYDELSRQQTNFSRATFVLILILLGITLYGSRKNRNS